MAPTRKYVRLSPSEWAEVRALWEVGDHTLEELSAKFGVSPRGLQAHFRKFGTVKGSQAAELAAAVREEVFRQELDDPDLLIVRAKDVRESAYRNALVIEDLLMAQLQAAQRDPSQAFKAASAVKTLSLASAALERLHGLKRAALGLDRNAVMGEQLPELVLRDLTEEEIEQLRSDPDDGLEVVGPGLDGLYDVGGPVDVGDDDVVVLDEATPRIVAIAKGESGPRLVKGAK